jgi:hypothetical protein
VDLSAIIFVVLALAWAVYLIPKALKHHDDMASDRLVEGHSDRVRILSRHRRTTPTAPAAPDTLDALGTSDEPAERTLATPVTRAAAGKAAQRRRRVLGVLLLALAGVWGFTWFAYLPSWAPAVPGALVVAWLVLARLSVRRAGARRRSAPARQHLDRTADEPAGRVAAAPALQPAAELSGRPSVQSSVQPGAQPMPEPVRPASFAASPRDVPASQDLVDLLAEDTVGVERQELEAAIAEEGSLWDPLPLTLPTYVNKARARRTVRTIELTGVESSGHDDANTALATKADAADAEVAAETEAQRRKASGA